MSGNDSKLIGVDTNVILNVLRTDDPPSHKIGSLNFFQHVHENKVNLCVSAITITELFRKPFKDNSSKEQEIVDSFLHFIRARTISISHDSAVEAARIIEEHHLKFADALIAFSLLFAGVNTFVTRNTADYKRTSLTVLTPEEFIKN